MRFLSVKASYVLYYSGIAFTIGIICLAVFCISHMNAIYWK